MQMFEEVQSSIEECEKEIAKLRKFAKRLRIFVDKDQRYLIEGPLLTKVQPEIQKLKDSLEKERPENAKFRETLRETLLDETNLREFADLAGIEQEVLRERLDRKDQAPHPSTLTSSNAQKTR